MQYKDKTVKSIAAAVALTLTLMACAVGTVLAAPDPEEGPTEPTSQVTTDKPVTTRPAVTSDEDKTSSKKPVSSEEEESSRASRPSSKASSNDADEEDSSSRTVTSREEEASSRDRDTTTSKKKTSSKSGGTLAPDDYVESTFDDISWGAQYIEETSTPSMVSVGGPVAKDIDNYYSIAMKWIWLPILVACASLFGLVAVNYRAARQKKLARQAAGGRARPENIPMRGGRRDRASGYEDDDVFIPGSMDISSHSSGRTGGGNRPARRTPPSHAKKKVRRPRD